MVVMSAEETESVLRALAESLDKIMNGVALPAHKVNGFVLLAFPFDRQKTLSE